MPLPSLPDECFSDIFSFLDNESLYKCLFVNRYYCKLSIPIIWRDPFTSFTTPIKNRISLINTLLSCLNEDEISSLIPCAIDLINFNNQPLFEYGNFIRKIDHGYFIDHIKAWLNPSIPKDQDCRFRKLVDAIYNMIMRNGSNLQEFIIYSDSDGYIDLPKFSTFTIYKPGITNLSSISIYDYMYGMKYQNTIEFLCMVSEHCNCIINCEVSISSDSVFTEQILNIVKLQPLKRVLLSDYVDIKKILYTLKEFRSETLKELLFEDIDFQQVDLSFISKLKFLERLEFKNCTEFTFKEKLHHLKELKLCYDYDYYDYSDNSNKDVKLHAISMMNLFCSEILYKLTLNIVTPETVKAVKETCPNISFLCIENFSEQSFNIDLTIPLICEISSLKILNIKLIGIVNKVNENLLIRLLCNHLMSVECLFLDFPIRSQNFAYFTSNCKVKLKRLYILVNHFSHLRKSYLVHVNNFQKAHNSLKMFGIKGRYGCKLNWTDEEIEIVNLLKNQGTDVVREVI